MSNKKKAHFNDVLTILDALTRVRQLHTSDTKDGVTFCTHCLDEESDGADYQLYPCETIKAVDGYA